jgi:CheY-like chemotaxis protein
VVVAFGGGVTSGRESELMEIGLEVLTNGDGIQNYLKVFSLKTGRFKLPILIVEDLDSPREIIEMYIEQMGYAVKSVASGEVALGLLQADPQGFFCVLTDIKMPNMNGVQFIKFVRQDEQIRHIPVIVLSAYGTGELLLDCLQAGASGFLAKPPRREDIVRELGRARRVALGLESVRLCESDKMSLVRDYLAQKGILD